MNRIIFAAIQTVLARILARKSAREAVINGWTRSFLDKLDNLKFLCYVGVDGFPVLIPAIQTQSLDDQHLLFSTSVYSGELEAIPNGVPLAVFSMALTMEDVLLRGKYQGFRRLGGVRVGIIEVDWVYSPMPPVPGQIYPPVPIQAITEFQS